jgi:uncharacterized protein YcfJ
MGLYRSVSSVRDVSRSERIADNRYAPPPPPAAPAAAQITFYELEGFAGRAFTTDREIGNLVRWGFNDRASSAVVAAGGRWEVCEDVQFGGRCVTLRPGNYPSLAAMGMNNRISSVRDLSAPVAVGDYRRPNEEGRYEAHVTSVRAVLGPPGQRCWVEREQVVQERREANVPGAVAGAVIGGIIGHQIGSGRGRDAATVGGAVAGAAVGANVDRGGRQEVVTQDVQRCESVPSAARPEFWDVTYSFRGEEHRVQMTAPPPGPTIIVNDRGEPRV